MGGWEAMARRCCSSCLCSVSPRFGMALVLSLCSAPHSQVGLQWACEDTSLGSFQVCLSFTHSFWPKGNTCF